MLTKSFNNQEVRVRESDRFVNLADMAKATGKRVQNWTRTEAAKEFLREYSDVAQIRVSHLIQTTQTGTYKERGTWAHPDVALQFAQWCNPRFAIQVSLWVRELMTTGKVDLKVDETTGELKTLRQQYEELEKQNYDLDQLAAELYGQYLTLKEINEELRDRQQFDQECLNKALDRTGKLSRQTAVQQRHGVRMHKLLVVIDQCYGSRKNADKERSLTALEEIRHYMYTGEL